MPATAEKRDLSACVAMRVVGTGATDRKKQTAQTRHSSIGDTVSEFSNFNTKFESVKENKKSDQVSRSMVKDKEDFMSPRAMVEFQMKAKTGGDFGI